MVRVKSDTGLVTHSFYRTVVAASWYAVVAVTAITAIGVELDRQAHFDPRIAALVPEMFEGDALENLVRSASHNNDRVQAEVLARKLVQRRPIPAEGLSLYAESLLANGKDEASAAAIQVAAGRGWRDRFVQQVVILSALQQDTPEIAANRVVALWRLGDRGDRLEHLTLATLSAPGGLSAFENALIERDRYLGTDFLVWATGHLRVAIVARLAKQLAAHHSELDCKRFSGQIDSLFQNGRVASATTVWNRFCVSGDHSNSNNLRFAPANFPSGPFDWRYPEKAGVEVELWQDRSNIVLHYSSSNPMLQVIARRYLSLSPGRHVLQVDKAAALSSTKWRVACVASNQLSAELSLEQIFNEQWAFIVPAHCPIQELTIAVRAGSGDIGPLNLARSHN